MARVIVANKTGQTDGSAYDFLQRLNVDIPIVLVSWNENFVFNDDLFNLDKYVLVDFVEMGWDYTYGSYNQIKYEKKFDSIEWAKFWQFISDRQPIVKFVRELPLNDAKKNVLPIEYPARYEPPQIVSREEFNSRPLEVFFNWGLSNPIRPQLHGEIWTNMNRYGYIVCDNLFNLNQFIQQESNPKKWVTVNTPHYGRFQVEEIFKVSGVSKLSVSLFGAGRKCFRNTEVSSNSIMICQEDDFAWTFPWIDGVNCFKFSDKISMVSQLNNIASRRDLYDIYVNGVANCERYYWPNYLKHLEGIIDEL